MSDESNTIEQLRTLVKTQGEENTILKSEKVVLEKVLKYYSSGESIQIHTDVANRAFYDCEKIRSGQ